MLSEQGLEDIKKENEDLKKRIEELETESHSTGGGVVGWMGGRNGSGGFGQSLLTMAQSCVEHPLWNMEWECGRLSAEKEFLEYCCCNNEREVLETTSREWYEWAAWGGDVPFTEQVADDPGEQGEQQGEQEEQWEQWKPGVTTLVASSSGGNSTLPVSVGSAHAALSVVTDLSYRERDVEEEWKTLIDDHRLS